MLTWQTTREQESFSTSYSSYSSTSQASYYQEGTSSFSNGVGGVPVSYTSSGPIIASNNVSISNANTYSADSVTYWTVSNKTEGFANTFITHGVEGSTYLAQSGFTSSSFEESFLPPNMVFGTSTYTYSTSSHSSTWTMPSYTYNGTGTSTESSTLTTTSTYSASTLGYTSTTDASSNTVSTTYSPTTTFTSNVDNSGNLFTTSTVLNITVNSSFTGTATAPIEYGTVVSAQGNDWLWSFTGVPVLGASFDSNSYFLSDIAATFSQQTFWNTYTTSTLPYTTYTAVSNATVGNDASSTAMNTNGYDVSSSTGTYEATDVFYPEGSDVTSDSFIESWTYTSTSIFTTASTVTTGSNFERDTTTVAIPITILDTGTIVGGIPANSYVSACFTYSSVSIAVVSSTTSTIAQIAPYVDMLTASVAVPIQVTTTYTYSTINPYSYSGSASASSSGAYADSAETSSYASYSSSTVYHAATTVFPIAQVAQSAYTYGYYILPTEIYEQVPRVGAFHTPYAMRQTDGMGTNISLSPSIYYPYTSSVVQSVLTPIPYNGTTNDGTNNWSYSWSSDSLSYTSATSTTTLSSTSTVTTWNSTSSSGVMVTEGSDTNTYWTQNCSSYIPLTAFGGYSPISTAAEIALFSPGAMQAVSYDSAGVSSTQNTIRYSYTSSTLIGTIRVENTIPVYSTTTASGGLPMTAF